MLTRHEHLLCLTTITVLATILLTRFHVKFNNYLVEDHQGHSRYLDFATENARAPHKEQRKDNSHFQLVTRIFKKIWEGR